jgi:hypothetical protein
MAIAHGPGLSALVKILFLDGLDSSSASVSGVFQLDAERESLRRTRRREPFIFLGVRLGSPLPASAQYGSTE